MNPNSTGKLFAFHEYAPSAEERAMLTARQCVEMKTVASGLDYLVSAKPDPNAGRFHRAALLGIPVLSVDEFRLLIQ